MRGREIYHRIYIYHRILEFYKGTDTFSFFSFIKFNENIKSANHRFRIN